MQTADLLVLGGLLAAACLPSISALPQKLRQWIPALPSPAKPTANNEEAWRQKWVSTLINLQSDLEERKQDAQVALCRSLIWQMLGGTEGGKR